MKTTIDIRKIWTLTLVFYIICSTAFSYGDLKILNSVALYIFLAVSVFNILHSGKLRLDLAAGSLIAYAVILLVGMLYTPASSSAVYGVMYNYITMMVLAVCIIQYVRSVKDVETIMFAYMLAGLTMAIYVYSLYGSEFWDVMKEAADSELGGVDRLGGDLTNENTISLCTAISALIALYNLMYARTSKVKTILCVGIMAFCFVVSMAAASKKSLILIFACIIGIWLYSTVGNKGFLKKVRNLLILGGSVVGLLYMINNIPLFSGISARFESLFSFLEGGSGTVSEEHRYSLISEGLAIFLKNPILGAGSNSSVFYFSGAYSHSNFVEILMNTGVIGFVVFYGVYVTSTCKYLAYARSYKQTNKVSVLLFSLLLGVTVCGFAMVYYYERYYMLLMTVVFAATHVFDRERSIAS